MERFIHVVKLQATDCCFRNPGRNSYIQEGNKIEMYVKRNESNSLLIAENYHLKLCPAVGVGDIIAY